MSLFQGVVKLNDGIEDETDRIENLIKGILAGNIFDLGSAEVKQAIIAIYYILLLPIYSPILTDL